MEGDTAKAKAEYGDFLTLWKPNNACGDDFPVFDEGPQPLGWNTKRTPL
jgi:hypothetical protein